MTVECAFAFFAGVIVLVSSSPWRTGSQRIGLWLTAFVGLNLIQSGFTNWCPAISIFKAMGLRSSDARS